MDGTRTHTTAHAMNPKQISPCVPCTRPRQHPPSFSQPFPRNRHQHQPKPKKGYGFSSAPKKRGFGITQIAAALDALMQGLGYDRYWAQGGDYGAVTCRALSRCGGWGGRGGCVWGSKEVEIFCKHATVPAKNTQRKP